MLRNVATWHLALTTSLALLVTPLPGCETSSVCVPPPTPPASCVVFSTSADGATETLTVTPACGIGEGDVLVTGAAARTVTVHVDADGRGATAYAPGTAQPTVTLEWGYTGCRLFLCVVRTVGPGAECGP